MKTGDLNTGAGAPKSDVAALTEMVYSLQKQLKEIKIANTTVAPGSNVDMAKVLAEFAAHQKNAENLDFQAGIREEDIPTDDYDEQGVLFCAPFTGYAISDDRRHGHRIVLPYNKPFIIFEHDGIRKVPNGKHTILMNMCKYLCKSKKEAEWLRKYTFFNTHIYESTKGVANFDVLKAQKLSTIMTHVSNWQMPQLIQGCKEHNIPISEDVQVMRTTLAMKMADVALDADNQSTARRLTELEAEKNLLLQARR